MLTEIDLAVVRAALQFLSEEFSADEEELFQHYLDDRGLLAGASTRHIEITAAKFEAAELYAARRLQGRDELVSNRLTRVDSGNEFSYQADREIPVSVIVLGD